MGEFKVCGKQVDAVKNDEGVDLELGEAFDEVSNLLWIKKNTVYDQALSDWDGKAKLLGASVDRREKRSQDLTNQVFNLVGFFSVFQGVVLTAVTQLTQSSRSLCGKVWVPVVLSGLAAIATIIGISLKFKHLYAQAKLIRAEKLARRKALDRARKLRVLGKNFKFSNLRQKQTTSDKQWIYWVITWVTVIGAALLFTVIFILAYFVILCDKWTVPGWR